MKLTTLINHSSELLRIIRKSPQAADKLASQYFRLKKYIGSKDRKFISECVFSSLRIQLLAEYCSKQASITADIVLQSKNTKINSKLPLKNAHNYITIENAIIIASCIISHHYTDISSNSIIKAPFYPMEVLPKILINDDFEILEELAISFSEISAYSIDKSKLWVSLIQDEFKSLDQKMTYALAIETLDNNSVLELISNRYSIPYWICEHLYNNGYDFKIISTLAESLLTGAPVCLRVNTKFMNREKVIAELKNSGIDSSKSLLSPVGIVLKKRVKIDNHPLFQTGIIEVQDHGSQLIAYALAPNENDSVLDACAGAGGKTLHIAALQSDKGNILATDIEINRLKEISKRAKRSGLKSISVKLLKKKDNLIKGKFDAILVDAPCSGMGTTRRMPMAKWRLNQKLLDKHNQNQLNILKHYSQYLKPGGIIVYATCSFMPAENDLLVEKFLEENNSFFPDSLYTAFEKNNIKIEGLQKDDYKLNLLPSAHGSDGFFMARMRKVEEEEE